MKILAITRVSGNVWTEFLVKATDVELAHIPGFSRACNEFQTQSMMGPPCDVNSELAQLIPEPEGVKP